MKNLKIAIFAFLLVAGINTTQAQDEDNLWALSFGVNIVDVNEGGLSDIGGMVSDFLGTGDWNAIPAISTISVSRYMNYGLSVGITGSLNKIDTAVTEDDVNGLSFFALNVAAKYDLNALFGETGWFDPNISFGVGSTWVDGDSGFTIKPGAGFNTWFNDNVGMSFDSSFNYSTSPFPSMKDTSNYFQHSIGLIIRFNGDE